MSKEKQKNPVMVLAGKKAAKTKQKNQIALAKKLSEAGKKAAKTKKINLTINKFIFDLTELLGK